MERLATITRSLLLASLVVLSAQISFAGAKSHSVFFKIGKINCPAIAYYTSMSTSSSTTSDSCENVTWIVKNDKEEQTKFAASNYALLEQQASQGQGPLVSDYAEVMHCGSAHDAFAKAVRENFDQIFSEDRSPENMILNTEKVIRARPELAHQCLTSV